MKKSIKSIFVLVMICAVVSVMMAVTNYITEPIIEKNEQFKANSALLEIMPDGGSFELVDTNGFELPATVSEVYKASNGGHVVKLITTGYNSGMVVMCGVSPELSVVGTKLVSSAETPSIGGSAVETFAPRLDGATIETVDMVDTVSGATKTTAAYRAATKDALNTALILGGVEVDLRSEKEILNDNLSAALPEAEGVFEKYFFVEEIEGIDAIYKASNGKGAVCVIGEVFIASDENGNVITDCSEEEAQTAEAAVEKMNSTKVSDVDLSLYEGLPKQLVSAKRTESGNYIIEIKGVGYGINGGEYHPGSGEYIYIQVSMTKNGKILDCLTLFQRETEGIGSACADESFYGQFDGRTPENYDGIDAISGATVTTKGYIKAISRAYECVKIFEEVK
jgi:Na+-translocating ferredoxin:NAD+ oxidoreductase RnfG subunit